MRLSLKEDIEGLTQRLDLMETLEDPNSSVYITNEHSLIAATPPPAPQDPASLARRELTSKSQEKFRELDYAFQKLSLERADRLRYLKECQEERLAAIRQRAEEEARQKAEQEAKLKAEREAREKAAREAEQRRQQELQKAEEERKQKAEEVRQRELKTKEDEEKAAKLAQEKQKAEQDAAKAEVEAKAKAEAEAQAKAKAEASTKAQTNTNTSANAEYLEHMKTIEFAKTQLNPQVSANKDLKKQCYELKITIKAKLGQLTHSKSHLMKSMSEIKAALDRAIQLGELAYNWLLNQFAKLVVQQAEGESRVDGRSAVPISMLVTLVWSEYGDLGKYLIARFVKKDPYLIGYWCPIDTEQGRKRMGYRRSDSGWESEVEHGERIGGITSVWAVITQSKMNVSKGTAHPYPITHSWIFLARTLNEPIEQITDAHFCAVAAWWDVAGSRFLDAFGKQSRKLLEVACTSWPDAVKDRKYPAANRLRLLGQDWQKSGKIEPIWKPLGP